MLSAQDTQVNDENMVRVDDLQMNRPTIIVND